MNIITLRDIHTKGRKMNLEGMDIINQYLSNIKKEIESSKIDLEQYEVFYRGENKFHKTTTPSIFRSGLENEHKIFRELELRYPTIFDNAKSTIDKLSIMQHYGLPTRLLDFTTNPLLSLYMACDNSDTENFSPTVKIVFVNKNKIKYYDSDTVSVFANFAKIDSDFEVDTSGLADDNGEIVKAANRIGKLGYKYLNNAEDFKTLPEELKYDAGKMICKENKYTHYLLHEVKSEKPYFRDMIWPEHFHQSVVFVKPKHNTQRVINQAGLFALFGLNNGKKEMFSLEECEDDGYFSITTLQLTNGNTPYLESDVESTKKALATLGITHDKVYPEIEYSSKYIKEVFCN